MSELQEDVEFDAGDEPDANAMELEKASEDAPVVKLTNHILLSAINQGASDIHIEPYEKSYRVRFRVDGVLREQMQPPLKLKNALSSRMKIMASLDIAERRLPQDGRIKLKIGNGKEMDFRVSRAAHAVRREDRHASARQGEPAAGHDQAGVRARAAGDRSRRPSRPPYGMVLVTGPTGSGKTTTLYSALQELNQVSDNICTAEDPVEFNLPGINQVPGVRQHRPDLRRRPALVPAAGPGHGHDR